MPFIFTFISLISWLPLPVHAQNKENSSNIPTFRMSGSALLTSHYIHRGLSQTHGDPALQVHFSYNLGPQIEFGLWGSNVRYESTNEHLNLQFYGGARVDFSTNAQLEFQYRLSRYFHDDSRNGALLDIKFNVFTYYILLESQSNWEGTDTSSSHFALGYNYKFGSSLLLDLNAAYNQLTAVGFNNYFDLQAELTYTQSATLSYTLGLSLNSESSQFNGDGDPYGYAKIKTTF